MYKIYYDDIFLWEIIKFSNYLKDYFFKLYTDTWIISEDIILTTYKNSIELLQKQIFDEIEIFCKNWLLWRSIETDSRNIET